MPIFGAEVPFADHCGIEEVGVFEGVTRLRVETKPHLVNNIGIVHGGLLCTLLDIALATAARIRIGRPVVTLDMQVAFVNPGRGALLGEGRVVRAGRSVVFSEAEVRQESDGVLVAKASGIFMPVRETRRDDGVADQSLSQKLQTSPSSS